METNKEASYNGVNKHSNISIMFGILTILSFCAGLIPFPFTGIICFPLSVLFGILAMIFGTISLNQIYKRNESGAPMAWVGIMIGGFVFLCAICIVILIASFFIFAPNLIQLPPFIQNFQI